MNTPQVKLLAEILRATVAPQATPNDALRLVEAMAAKGLVVTRAEVAKP